MTIDPSRGSLRDYLVAPAVDIEQRATPFEAWRSARESAGYWPYAKYLLEAPGPHMRLQHSDGAQFSGINFATQDYLSLSSHPAVREAAIEAIREYGVHSAGSTALAGNVHTALMLEASLAEWLCTEHVLLFPTGWAAGYGVIKGLVHASDHVVLDELAHNCLQEGAMAATRNVHRHRHLDVEAVRTALATIRAADRTNLILVVTEGTFSMDADSPDLPRYQAICREFDATLVVDVAHDLGNCGPNGTGQIGLQGMLGKIDIVMGSFSKTFASNGGFIATRSKAVKEYVRYCGSPNIFSNALSPAQIAAVLAAVSIIRAPAGQALRERLARAVDAVREEFEAQSLTLVGAPHAIVPVVVGAEIVGRYVSRAVASEGVLVNLAEFPVVPVGRSRFRLQVMAGHDPDDCRNAARLIATCIRRAEAELTTEHAAP